MKKIQNYTIRTDVWYEPREGFWLDIKGDTARIGMNPLLQETTGAFVAIRMLNSGATLKKGESFASVEAEKHVGHLKLPLSGKIQVVNPMVLDNPRLLNLDPYGDGWLVEIEINDFEGEKNTLLHGEVDITSWFEAELTKYNEKGWLAEP